MSHVFGSNTSASSWKPLLQARKKLIPIYFERDDLVIKHKNYIDILKWQDKTGILDLVQAKLCKINGSILDALENLIPPTAKIYVDDIMQTASQKIIIKLLVATIQAIFTVCGKPDTNVQQCPLFLKMS
jgi:hypothetical protein